MSQTYIGLFTSRPVSPRRLLDHPAIPWYTVFGNRPNLCEGWSIEQQQRSENLKAAEELSRTNEPTEFHGQALSTARRSSPLIVQSRSAR